MNSKLKNYAVAVLLLCSAVALSAADSLDTTFDPASGVNGFAESVVVQPDGKVLVCGSFTEMQGAPRPYIARLNADGSLDTNFNGAPNYWVRTMALEPSGKIVIGGFFTSVSGISRNRIARLNPDGTLDATFDPGTGCLGRIVPADPTDSFLFALGVQADGKIIIGGNFTNYNGINRRGVARLNSDGSLDTSFAVGTGVDSWVRSILILPDSQILLSGWFQNYNSRPFNRIVRLNQDGSADRGFNAFFGDKTAVYTMGLQSDGKLVVGGHSVSNTTAFHQEVARLNTDGTYDSSFNAGGDGADDKVQSLVVQPDGKIVIAGYFGLYNGVRRKGVARLNSDGSLDPTFNAEADNWVWTATLQPDGRIFVAGAFRKINGIPRSGVARLTTPESPAPPPPPVEGLPTIVVKGSGTIAPDFSSQPLEFGQSYTITATPRVNSSFMRWSGFSTSTNPTITFVMESNLTLQANFVLNSGAAQGTYSGLFFETNQPSHESSGYFLLKTTKTGRFSGKLISAGITYPLRGQIDGEQGAQFTVARRGKTALEINLQLGSDGVVGTVSDGSFTSELLGQRATFDTSNRATDFTGKFTFLLPGNVSPSPSGHGFAALVVNANGAVSVRGVLSDGTAFSQKTFVAGNGESPFYVSLYRGNGSIFGWLTFTNLPSGDVHGALQWVKTSAADVKNYPAGFTNLTEILGSRFAAPPRGVPVLNFTNATALLEGGNLPTPSSNSIALNTKNKFVVVAPNANRLTLTVSPATGLLRGRFLNPTSGKTSQIKGVLLQKQNVGGGFFVEKNENGLVYLGELNDL